MLCYRLLIYQNGKNQHLPTHPYILMQRIFSNFWMNEATLHTNALQNSLVDMQLISIPCSCHIILVLEEKWLMPFNFISPGFSSPHSSKLKMWRANLYTYRCNSVNNLIQRTDTWQWHLTSRNGILKTYPDGVCFWFRFWFVWCGLVTDS